MDKKTRFAKRLSAIRQLLERERIGMLRLTLQKNISWLIGGRTHVNTASEPACCQVLISQDACILISNNIESRRLLEEEIGFAAEDGGITGVEQWNWFDPAGLQGIIERHTSGKGKTVTDGELEGALLGLRSRFDEDEFETVRALGRLTAEAIEQAAFDVERGDTEYKIAGRLAYRCWERGLEPIVNLIAADERIYARRHPLPTDKSVDRYAMLVVCARKNGVIFSATRLVHFGPLSNSLRRLHQAVEIDARVIDATRPGVTLADLYEKLRQFYRDAGYEAEYQHHHQGGLTGYNTRERLALPTESLAVQAGQLYAWNPSLTGVKSEDTLLVRADDNELVTGSAEFPRVQVKVGERVWERPDILVRQLI